MKYKYPFGMFVAAVVAWFVVGIAVTRHHEAIGFDNVNTIILAAIFMLLWERFQ